MKQHLDTAPVLEAMRAGGECPMCALKRKNEADYVDYFLGGSVMEVSSRLEVNEKGFCHRHLEMLFDAENRLSLALLQSSHLTEVIRAIRAQSAPRRSLFKKQAPQSADTEKCALCDRLEATIRRYALTVAALWEEPGFPETLRASQGFCLTHYRMIREEAPGALSGKQLEAFVAELDRVEIENLERLKGELDWFCQKHDYRNADKPWGESRDAVERAVAKLRAE